MNDYDPVILTRDAVKFAQSKFGRHYLKKLASMSTDYTSSAKDRRLTNEQRGEYGLRAAEIDDLIAYFKTAQTVAKSPDLLERLKRGYRKRMGKEEPED